MVTLALPDELTAPVIKIKPPEIMLLGLPGTKSGAVSARALNKAVKFCDKADAAVIGPGMSGDVSAKKFIKDFVGSAGKPLIIDADGLNALAGERTPKFPLGTVITPHPGEMARLLGISAADVEKKRKKVAIEYATHYNITTVLKGWHTVVASPDGKTYVNQTGNPGMATAGSGDVLAGIIGAFLAQGLGVFDSAKYGVYLHGLAGDLAAKEKTQISLIASDIIEFLPKAIKISS